MNNSDILNQVLKIASEVFSVPESKIDKNTQQGDFENWDSLGHLNFILALEEKLNVKFLSTDIIHMKSIEDIVNKIQ